jgi:NADH dehydrogenase
MQGLVTIFGGSGFIGSHAVRALAKRGHRIRVAVRSPGRGYKLRLLGDVGQIEVVQANIRNPASIARAMAGAQVCVNLVAVLYESGRQKFQSLHVMGARNIAEAARAEGVERFVQVSAIGADPESPSKYGRTKAMGEAAVREILPSATILRPSIVFGTEDHFFNRFAAMASISPVLPVVGAQTRFQPVFVGDVAAAIAAAAAPETEGRTYELGGPGVYTFKALMALMLRETGRKPLVASVPFPIASLIGSAGDLVAGLIPPPLTSDQVKMLRNDNVVAPGALTLADLGVEPTALEAILPTYLFRYRKGGQYAEAIARGA